MKKNKVLSIWVVLLLIVSCSVAKEKYRTYGIKGGYDVAKPLDLGKSVIYYPEKIKTMEPLPVVFFLPGWKSTNHRSYRLILSFIASHGYVAILAKDDLGEFKSNYLENYLLQAVEEFSIKLDTTKIGIIGYSSGGGHAFSILNNFSKNKKWGSKGRFIVSLDPWFSFDMNQSDMSKLPSNTNVIVMKFANDNYLTDTRISINQFALLSSISKDKKDYHFVREANHSYVFQNQNVNQQIKILKPLDGLLEYTFKDVNNHEAKRVALGVGKHINYKDVFLLKKDRYRYRCDGKDKSKAYEELLKKDIDYCAVEVIK